MSHRQNPYAPPKASASSAPPRIVPFVLAFSLGAANGFAGTVALGVVVGILLGIVTTTLLIVAATRAEQGEPSSVGRALLWLLDTDSFWRPFVALRPAADRELSTSRALLFSAAMSVVGSVFGVALFSVWDIHIRWSPLLFGVLVFDFSELALVLAGAPFWNARATRARAGGDRSAP